jgi:hypothetical protein
MKSTSRKRAVPFVSGSFTFLLIERGNQYQILREEVPIRFYVLFEGKNDYFYRRIKLNVK